MNHEHDPGKIEALERAVLETVADLAPEITLYGSADPKTLEVDPEEFRRLLPQRLKVERAVALHYRRRSESGWSLPEGLYIGGEKDMQLTLPLGERPLIGTEAELAKNIDHLLRERSDSRPIVALDFGGGAGVSWARIAAQPQHKAAIAEGRLIMAVTNLGTVPQLSTDDSQYSREELQWVRNNQDRIQYLDANALELANKSVHLPNGGKLFLEGNIDIIHESFALTHTHAPDLALASFDKLLSGRGVLYSDAATYYHMMHPALFMEIVMEDGEVVSTSGDYSYQRRLALVVGAQLLQRRGFSYRVDERNSLGIFTRRAGG